MTHFKKEGSEPLEQETRSVRDLLSTDPLTHHLPSPRTIFLLIASVLPVHRISVCFLISRSSHTGPEQYSFSSHFLCSSVCLALFFHPSVFQKQKSFLRKDIFNLVLNKMMGRENNYSTEKRERLIQQVARPSKIKFYPKKNNAGSAIYSSFPNQRKA